MDALALRQAPLADACDAAGAWLFTSGVYVLEPSHPQHGAVYSYYDRDQRRFRLVYAEATGYVISLLRYLHAARPDRVLVERATASGDWLVRWARANGGLIAAGIRDDQPIRAAYAFDGAICCRGLVDLYTLTGDARYLGCAERIADWLVGDVLNADGSARAVFDIDARRFRPDGEAWYESSGSFHAKLAMPLLGLHAITKRRALHDAALRICAWAVRQQRPDGAFPANRRIRAVNLHAHCYTLEALLYAYGMGVRDGPDLLGSVARGIDWMLNRQGSDGCFWLWHGRTGARLRASYAQAQAVRLLALANLLDPAPRLAGALERAAAFLVTLQVAGAGRECDGGFPEQETSPYWIRARASRQVASWATMFAVQALRLAAAGDPAGFAHAVEYLF